MLSGFLHTGSIKGKLRRINLLTIGSAFVIAIVLLTTYDYLNLSAELLEDSRVKAQLIGRNSASAMVFDDAKAAAELLGSLDAEKQVLSAALWNEQGQRLASYRASRHDADDIRVRPDHGYALTPAVLDVAQPVTIDGKDVGTVALRLDLSNLYLRLVWHAVAFARGDPDRVGAVACIAVAARTRPSPRRFRTWFDVMASGIATRRLRDAGADRVQGRDRRAGQGFQRHAGADPGARPAPGDASRRAGAGGGGAHRGAAQGEGSGRSRQPGQERVPRHHEPRDPHADERHPRHDRAAARHGAQRPATAASPTPCISPASIC